MPKQQSISKILNARIALVVICVNILICVIFYLFSVNLSRKDFEKQRVQQTSHLAETLTQQLWLFDIDTAERLADLAYETQQVSGIRLSDHDGRVLVEKGHVDKDDPYYTYRYLIHESGANVGSLQLVFTDVGHREQRNNILFIGLVVVSVTILLSFVLISRVIQHDLVRPLDDLQQSMEELATGHFKVTSQNAKTVEIKAIIDAFNAMAMALALKAEERRAVEKQRKKLENELRQKYKMEAVGLMAGGIAHNFNNNLAIILGNLELIQLKTVDNDSIADHLRDANIAVQRARELTKQILTYSRRDAHPAEQIKIVKVVAETVQLLRSTIPTTVNLICRIPEELSETVVEGDSTRIQEALINLCNNAVQAMDEKGDLTIDLSKKEVRPAEVPAGSPCRAGAYVRLSVADTGCGMPPAVMEKIFDPFFTTKDVDQGTGMGLSTVHGIVEQHKGFVSVSSTPGRGSVFDLFLPESDATGLFPARRESNDLPRGFERILFVDDDALLADLGVMLLSNQGYHVEASTSSLAALERFAEDPNRFDLLITDQTMPQMTGLDLARQVRRIRPAMPVILSTGYSSKTSPEELARHGINAFCLKPLKLADLAQTVRFVLDNIKH